MSQFLKKMLQLSFFVSIILLFYNKANASNIYVYCSDKNSNWNWLSNQNVKVNGQWVYENIVPTLYIKYFIIQGGVKNYIKLRNECIKEFGIDYIYPQPAGSAIEGWHTFAIDEKIKLPGVFSYIVVPRGFLKTGRN